MFRNQHLSNYSNELNQNADPASGDVELVGTDRGQACKSTENSERGGPLSLSNQSNSQSHRSNTSTMSESETVPLQKVTPILTNFPVRKQQVIRQLPRHKQFWKGKETRIFIAFILMAASIMVVQMLTYMLGNGEQNYFNFLTRQIAQALTQKNAEMIVGVKGPISEEPIFLGDYLIIPSNNSSEAILQAFDSEGLKIEDIKLGGGPIQGLVMDNESDYLYVYGHFGIGRLQVRDDGSWSEPASWPDKIQPIWQNQEKISAPYVAKMVQKYKDVFYVGQFKQDGDQFYKVKCITLFDFKKNQTMQEECFLPTLPFSDDDQSKNGAMFDDFFYLPEQDQILLTVPNRWESWYLQYRSGSTLQPLDHPSTLQLNYNNSTATKIIQLDNNSTAVFLNGTRERYLVISQQGKVRQRWMPGGQGEVTAILPLKPSSLTLLQTKKSTFLTMDFQNWTLLDMSQCGKSRLSAGADGGFALTCFNQDGRDKIMKFDKDWVQETEYNMQMLQKEW